MLANIFFDFGLFRDKKQTFLEGFIFQMFSVKTFLTLKIVRQDPPLAVRVRVKEVRITLGGNATWHLHRVSPKVYVMRPHAGRQGPPPGLWLLVRMLSEPVLG
jgi:hypothetical protein